MPEPLFPFITPGPAVVGRPHWLDEFARASDWRAEGREGELRALIRSGVLHPVGRGVARWSSFASEALARGAHPRDDTHLARVRAAALNAPPRAVTSHESAALLWGLQALADWPARVSQTVPVGSDARTSRWVVRHASSLSGSAVVDGVRVTTPERTVADVARFAARPTAFELAATAMFAPRAGQPLTTIDGVQRELDRLGAARGVRAARAVVGAVGSGCESAAEARSLMLILDSGFQRPEQQVRLGDHEGGLVVDYLWRGARLIGECDGLTKYLRADRGDGRAAAEAVVAEKRREDRLRGLGWRVVRWTTSTLRDPTAFAAMLDRAGAPRVGARRR